MADREHLARWRFDALTRADLSELAPVATVLVPLGSTEQHGYHLPVRVDTSIVTALAERATAVAAKKISIVVTPTVPFGLAEHHLGFGGTVSLTPATYASVLSDIGTSLGRQGFTRIVFLNGHGGNEAAMRFVVDKLAFEPFAMSIAGASYWGLAGDALAAIDLDGTLVPGHAGHFETSLMLALQPDLVRLERRPHDASRAMPIATPEAAGAIVRRSGQWQRSDGRSDDASEANAELGARVLNLLVERVADFLVTFHRSTHDSDAAPSGV